VYSIGEMRMVRYGQGLGREIYKAAKLGIIKQPFEVKDCRQFSLSKNWDVPESYIRVVLSNSEVDRNHSKTCKNYFRRVAEGSYRINPDAGV